MSDSCSNIFFSILLHWPKIYYLSFFQTFLILAVAAMAAADNAPRYGYAPAPAYAPAAYKEPSYDEPPVYAYTYAVADDYSGAKFNAGENRDGYATSGSYSVALPDGRIQTVNYKFADAYSGYVADVSYSGEPHYAAAPAYKPAATYAPAPAYAPTSVYKTAPVYRPAPYNS